MCACNDSSIGSSGMNTGAFSENNVARNGN
jgi:hypothetical protein